MNDGVVGGEVFAPVLEFGRGARVASPYRPGRRRRWHRLEVFDPRDGATYAYVRWVWLARFYCWCCPALDYGAIGSGWLDVAECSPMRLGDVAAGELELEVSR